jgi:hypothetical protein
LQFAVCNLPFEMLYSRCASLALRKIAYGDFVICEYKTLDDKYPKPDLKNLIETLKPQCSY